MAARNIRNVNKRIANGEVFSKDLGLFAGHKKTKPPPEAPQWFHDAHKIFRDTGHIESLQTTREAQDAIFDKEMVQFYDNPTQFYNTHKDDPTCKWTFAASNHRIHKIFEHHHMERWFDDDFVPGNAHFTNKEWKAFGF